jgi:hypothetical protein
MAKQALTPEHYRQKLEHAVRWLASHESGLLILSHFGFREMERTAFTGQSNSSFHNEGRRDHADELLKLLRTVDLDLYQRTERAHVEEMKKYA